MGDDFDAEADYDLEETLINNAETNVEDSFSFSSEKHETQHIVVKPESPQLYDKDDLGPKLFNDDSELYGDNTEDEEKPTEKIQLYPEDSELYTSEPLSSPSTPQTPKDIKATLGKIKKTRYFILCSKNEQNVKLAIEHSVWATQPRNEEVLNEAFKTCDSVLLFFYVVPTGTFHGYARMASPAEKNHSTNFREFDKWGKTFTLAWQQLFDLDFNAAKHLTNPWNQNKPIYQCRDGSEIEPQAAIELRELFDRGTKFQSRLNSHLVQKPTQLENGQTVYPAAQDRNQRRNSNNQEQAPRKETYPPRNGGGKEAGPRVRIERKLVESQSYLDSMNRLKRGRIEIEEITDYSSKAPAYTQPNKRHRRNSNVNKNSQWQTTTITVKNEPTDPSKYERYGNLGAESGYETSRTRNFTNDGRTIISGFVIEKDHMREPTPEFLTRGGRDKSRDRSRRRRRKRRRRSRSYSSTRSRSDDGSDSDSDRSRSRSRRRRRKKRKKSKGDDVVNLLTIQQNLQQLALLKLLSANPDIAQALQQPGISPVLAQQLVASAIMRQQAGDFVGPPHVFKTEQ